MVKYIKRDTKDIYSMPILGFLFKNPKFLLVFRLLVAGLFFWAIFLGFSHTSKENTFTPAIFWGIFWSFFMVLTLPTFGRIFCGICPHGFLGKYITKFGLKKTMPKWLQNRYIGIFLLVVGWWGVYYMFPGVYRTPFGTAMMFTVLTIVAFVIYFIYKDMSYCKYICPIGTMTRAYAKLSFTKLGSYKSACSECRTFECASACPYNLKPFSFEKKNNMDDCTLCMECSNSCEAIYFKFTKPASSLEKKFKALGAEVWAYIFILASIPISMAFAHGLNRSKIADEFIWSKTAKFFEQFIDFGSMDAVGLFAWIYALIFTVLSAVFGMWIASKILKKDFKYTFYTLGYAFAPLFIINSLSHTLSSFFTRGYDRIVEGFLWGFGFGKVDIASLASRGDKWLMIFGILKWVAIIWALVILYKRFKLIDAPKNKKILAFPFAALLIIFVMGVNIYRAHVLEKYGQNQRSMRGMHGMHGMHSMNMKNMYQSVPLEKAKLLKNGKDKDSCSVCGMKLHKFYKTNHAAKVQERQKQYCSIHCLYEDMKIRKKDLKEIKVVDTNTLEFIDAKKAFYVVGSKKSATMSGVSKYAFKDKKDAVIFSKKYGGKVVDFESALKLASKDFKSISKDTQPKDTIFFVDRKPSLKRGSMHRGMMHMGGRNQGVPKRKFFLATSSIKRPLCVKDAVGEIFVLDPDHKLIKPSVKQRECLSVEFEVPKNGFYTIYYMQDLDDVINIAKYEYKRFDHQTDEAYDPKKHKAVTIKEIPFDILRLRSKDESFYSRLRAGEEVKFKVLKDQKPVKGAKVKLTTQFGWSKVARTDENGIAKVKLIKDYMPKKERFNKRFREKFIVTATYKDGDKLYKISYTNSFVPPRDEFMSVKYSLILISLFILLISGAIFFYRARVQKPYKEVRFDED